MNRILKLHKNVGETPLECIERFRAAYPEYKQTSMTYLGRLDPMAEGLLMVLAGDTRDKDEYLKLDKTYEFEVLWGFETDTYDVLGLVTDTGPIPVNNLERKMLALLKKIASKKTQEYPPYSSRTVGGKPLHTWAREGRIDEIEIPSRGIKIFDIEHIHTRLVKQKEILDEVVSKTSLVTGDFRQEEIQALWKQLIKPNEFALVSKFRAHVSSGTYIRSLAHEMGKELHTCALAFNINRTRVGSYKLD